MMPTLDWRPKPDTRSATFRFAAYDCYQTGTLRKNIRRRKADVFLDQGVEGACTGFGCAHVLALSPGPRDHITNDFARAIYHKARTLDEWPGESYEGSSVNGAMKAAREMGLITEWRWAYNETEIQHGLSWHVAAEIGVWWYDGMWEPDAQGVLRVKGRKSGGHALALSGYKTTKSGVFYRLENSWGKSWGDSGGCWISDEDLMGLIDDDGECSFPVKA